MSKFGKELVESAREALAIAEERLKPARVIVPEPVAAKEPAGIKSVLDQDEKK